MTIWLIAAFFRPSSGPDGWPASASSNAGAAFLVVIQRQRRLRFPKILAERWKQRRSDVDAVVRSLTRQLEAKRETKTKLVLARVNGEITQQDCQSVSGQLEAEITAIEQKLMATQQSHKSVQQLLTFADTVLRNLGTVWQTADLTQRVRVQKILWEFCTLALLDF